MSLPQSFSIFMHIEDEQVMMKEKLAAVGIDVCGPQMMIKFIKQSTIQVVLMSKTWHIGRRNSNR